MNFYKRNAVAARVVALLVWVWIVAYIFGHYLMD